MIFISKLKKTIVCFSSVFFVVFTTFFVSASNTAVDVKLSSINYGFMDLGVPYAETVPLPPKRLGGSIMYASQLYGINGSMIDDTYPFSRGSYSAVASIQSISYDSSSNAYMYPANQTLSIVQSISFDKEVKSVVFLLRYGSGVVLTGDVFSASLTSGSSAFSYTKKWDSYYNGELVSLYNINAPVHLNSYLKTTTKLNSVGYSISLYSIVFKDGHEYINNQLSSINTKLDDVISILRASSNGTKAITDNADKNASQIKQNADKNASEIQKNANDNASKIQENQDKNTDKIIENDYGYQKPDNKDTDEGLAAGGNLLDELTENLDKFNSSLNEDTTSILNDLEPFKQMTHKVFGVLPAPVQYLVSFTVIFLVIRKVVGR